MDNTLPEALRLADLIDQYNTGVCSQAIYEDYARAAAELRRLHAECEALRAKQSDSRLRLLTDLRFVLVDNGARMQPELVEYAGRLRADAERYRWLREHATDYSLTQKDGYGGRELLGWEALDAAIDAARAAIKEQA